MRNVVRGLSLLVLISLVTVGCGGGSQDEVLDYDPEVSEQQAADYEAEMREAMQQQGRPPGQ